MTDSKQQDNEQDPLDNVEMPFIAHLVELRNRLLKIVIVVIILFACLIPFANELYQFIAKPMIAGLPENSSMIATGVVSPFFTPFKLAMVMAFFIAIPFVLHQTWAFISPGLYQKEKKFALPLLISSILLFYLGMAFCYYVVFPIAFTFISSMAPTGVQVLPDISDYLDIVLKMFFAFGLAFEVPIATILLVWSGITTRESLAQKRPYIIVAAFVIGMLLTPPDVISQTLLAIPILLLYELGLFFSRFKP